MSNEKTEQSNEFKELIKNCKFIAMDKVENIHRQLNLPANRTISNFSPIIKLNSFKILV